MRFKVSLRRRQPIVEHRRRLIVYLVIAVWTATVAEAAYLDETVERDGVKVRIRLEALDPTANRAEPRIDEIVRLRIVATRLADGQPLSRWPLGAWLDRHVSVASGAVPVCGQRLAGLLSGNLMQRPLVDMTGYFVATLDAEHRVSVLDPGVDFSGRTSLFTTLPLGGRPLDWSVTEDDTRMFVALSESNRSEPNSLAVIDTLLWRIQDRLVLPGIPTRTQLSTDERLLWVGLRPSTPGSASTGAVAIDTHSAEILGRFALADGHHEFAFSGDGRLTFISSREAGQIVAVDNTDFRIVAEREIHGEPIDLLFVPTTRELWVANARSGEIIRFDATLQARATINLEPGLGPMALTPTGQLVLALNPSQHRVSVVDAYHGEVRRDLTISGRPYDVAFTEMYAYVRALDSDQVALLALASLKESPFAQAVPIGQSPPGHFPGLVPASTMAPALSSTGMFFAVPSDRTIYHFMEGMNAPDSSVQTFGHTPLAIQVVSRGLRETSRGHYETVFKLPASGRLVVALASDTPRLRECLAVDVLAPPPQPISTATALRWSGPPVSVAKAGELVELRFELDTLGTPRVLLVPGSGGTTVSVPAKSDRATPRQFVARAAAPPPGGYFIYVSDAGVTLPALGSVPATLHVQAMTDSSPESKEQR